MKNIAVVLASGVGSRCKTDIPKQFLEFAGKTVLEHTLSAFERVSCIDEIILVITPEYRAKAEDILEKANFKKISKVLNGGLTRKDSSSIAIASIDEVDANVLIHDCARPFISSEIIEKCVKALETSDAVCVAVSSSDTLLKISDNKIQTIPDRKDYMRAQTPQCFKLDLIRKAHKLAEGDNNFTDDCGLVLRYNLSDISIVEGDVNNIKITYPEDLKLAEMLFNQI